MFRPPAGGGGGWGGGGGGGGHVTTVGGRCGALGGRGRAGGGSDRSPLRPQRAAAAGCRLPARVAQRRRAEEWLAGGRVLGRGDARRGTAPARPRRLGRR